ncbi:MAG: hypothetical protein C0465_24395 [Ralstonia sp.]|uniref:O-antigen ligase family protein n=1 Tax=Ralstonia sp. TaxID=54061 RepID=UPI0025794512|nr:O-antigen ligase family protein [Ralstonia sp.]MBA4233721.1 hypothetical protein [Ralstonia sp.]
MNRDGSGISTVPRPLGGYTQHNFLMRAPYLGYLALTALVGSYGLAFALHGVEAPAPYLAPIGLMIITILWIMPEVERPPEQWIGRLVVGFLIALVGWPDYLALTFPGLPWISAIRLFGIPLMAVLTICWVGSPSFRAMMLERMTGDRLISGAMLAFFVICALSVVLSKDTSSSLNKFFVATMTWFFLFIAGIHYFATPGRVRVFANLMLSAVILSTAIGLYEWQFNALPWKDRIPWFLAVHSPQVDAILAGITRSATGVYRVQSKFSSSIGLGEFFGMALPFVLHLMTTTKSQSMRIMIALLLPFMFVVVLQTDSRLAFISFFSSLIIYILYAFIDRWRRRKDSLFAPAIVLIYPILLSSFIFASFFWRRLSVKVWGGGAQSFSSDSREIQVSLGIPKILARPFGYGIGQGADTLGYVAPGYDIVTIDSYFLAAALEFGVIGFLILYGLLAWAVVRSMQIALRAHNPDVIFLAPAAIGLANFILSKSIYSQTENHPLAFFLVGMVLVLLYRERREGEQGAVKRALAATNKSHGANRSVT